MKREITRGKKLCERGQMVERELSAKMTFFTKKKAGLARRDSGGDQFISPLVGRARHNMRQGYLRNMRHANEYTVCALVKDKIQSKVSYRCHCLDNVYVLFLTWIANKRVTSNYK